MRIRNNPQAEIHLRALGHFLLEPEKASPLDLDGIFPGKPVYLELGMGRGGFLLRMARSHPDRAFIGVEMLKEVLAQGVRRAEAEGLENCRFVWTRIREIDTWFRPGAVAGIYLNFSDPWPKERHGKRRLTHPDCLARYRRILAPGGFVQFRTDNRELFEYSLNAFLESDFAVRNVRLDWHSHRDSAGAPRTEYEEKFAQSGKSIYQLEAFPR